MEQVGEIVKNQVVSVQKTEEKYRQIAEATKLATDSVSGMSASIEVMDREKTEILEIIQNLSAIAEENAASTEEASASTEEQSASMEEVSGASEELSAIAQSLQGTVSRFKL